MKTVFYFIGILSTFGFLVACGTNPLPENAREIIRPEWKIGPGDTIVYKTTMNELTEQAAEVEFSKLFSLFLDSVPSEADSAIHQFFHEFRKATQNIYFVTYLTESPYFEDVVEIRMVMRKDTIDRKENEKGFFEELLEQTMLDKTALRGTVYKKGGLHSFWVKQDQKNLLSPLFELPERPVRPGDVWELKNVSMIMMDQNFRCKKAERRNKVTLVSVTGPEAVFDYDIYEHVEGDMENPFAGLKVPTTMTVEYKARAVFDLEQGKWKDYKGLMSIKSEGWMKMHRVQEFRLKEIKR